MTTLDNSTREATPYGKRSVRSNIYGNIVGYVGGKRFREFGEGNSWNDMQAEAWLRQPVPDQLYEAVAAALNLRVPS